VYNCTYKYNVYIYNIESDKYYIHVMLQVNEDQTRSLVSDIKDIRFVDVNAGVIDFYALYRDDQAYYICRAINSAGSVESRGYLDVLSKYDHPTKQKTS
jgi:hypothetical protein